MSISDDLLNYKPTSLENPLVEQAEQAITEGRQKFAQDALGAVKDWYTGAVQGAEEVGRSLSALAAVSPERVSDLGVDTSEPTEKDKAELARYEQATKNVRNETLQPLAAATALTGNVYGFLAVAPFVAEHVIDTVNKKGAEGVGDVVTDLVPIYGSYKMIQNPDFQAFAKEHPARAVGLLLANEAPNVLPAKEAFSLAWKLSKNVGEKLKNTKLNIVDDTTIKEMSEYKTKMSKEASSVLDRSEKENYTDGITEDLLNYTEKEKRRVEGEQERASLNKDTNNDDVILKEVRVQKEREKEADNFFFKSPYTGKEVKAAPSNLTTNDITINDIWKAANDITTARPGRLAYGVGKSTLGYFEIKPKGIRTRNIMDFDVLSHEIGHHLDKIMKITGADRELVHYAETKWGGAYPPKQRRAEGIADFTAYYVYNPEVAKTYFPEYYEKFVNALASHPEINKKLDTLANLVRRFFELTPQGKIKATTKYKPERVPWKDRVSDVGTDLYSAFVDSTYKARKTLKDAIGNVDQRIDPTLTAGDIKGQIPGRYSLLTGQAGVSTKAVINYLNKTYNISKEPLREVTLKDVLNPIDSWAKRIEKRGDVKKTNKEWLKEADGVEPYEAFSNFLIAKRFLEVSKIGTKRIVDKLSKEAKTLETEMAAATSETIRATLFKKMLKIQERLAKIQSGKEQVIKTPLPLSDYETVVKEAPKAFNRAAEKLRDYNYNILRLAEEGGLIDKKTRNYFIKNQPDYIPLKRDFSIEQGFIDDEAVKIGKSSYSDLPQYWQKLSEEGSERMVLDPLSELDKATYRLFNMIEHNRVAVQLTDLAQLENVGSKVAIRVGGWSANPTKQIINVWKNGKREAWQITDKTLYDFISSHGSLSNALTLNLMVKLMRNSATLLRLTATSTPVYMLSNFIKDSLTAVLTSKTGLSLKDIGTQGFKLRKNDEVRAAFIGEGVHHSTLRRSEEEISKRLRGYAGDIKENPYERAKGRLKRSTQFYVDLLEAVEEAPRYAEFKKLYGVDTLTAGRNAKDITVNFSRSGSAGRIYNTVTPFFNAAIQGTDKIVRAFKEQPVKTSIRAIEAITLPSIALWYMNKDKEWYRDLPQQEQYRFWFVEVADGVVLRIPKPEMIGYAFGSVPEIILNRLNGDEKAMDNVAKLVGESAVPNLLPTAALVPIEWGFNYSLFRDKPIVPLNDQKKPKSEQYNIYTSEFSKGVGKLADVSPMKLDYAIKSQFADVGTLLLDMSDILLKDNQKPAKSVWETNRFRSSSFRGSRTSDVFYDNLSQLEGIEKSRTLTRKEATKLQGLRSANRSITKIRNRIKEVTNSKTLTGKEKRNLINTYNDRIKEVQKKAIDRYTGYKYIRNVN